MEEENPMQLLQHYRRDRHILLNFLLSGNLIKKVVMPPGAVSLDDVDIDQLSVDYVLNCAKKGETLDLAEAIRLYHDSLDYPSLSETGAADEFYLVTRPELSGSPPARAPPPVPAVTELPIPDPVPSAPILADLSKSQSFHSQTVDERELTIDDIEDFDDDGEGEFSSARAASRRQQNDATDLSLLLPPFTTGISDDDLRETA